MQSTPTRKPKSEKRSKVLEYFTLTVAALVVPTHFAFAASIWDNITSWGKGALSAVADFGMDLILTPIVWIAHFINSAANLFLLGMGYMLDTSISYTIDSSIYKSVSAIQVGWTAVRDFSNMFFIFILLYIAIITILGMARSSTKTLVAHVIIAALLINFSLFITQVVIDAGNILALGFWNKMITQQGTASGPSASAFFMEGFRVQTEFDSIPDGAGGTQKVTKSTQIMIYLGGAAVSLVAGYVFLAGAVMMIIRSVTLMILMIASPFAFLSFALPKRGEFWGQWTGKLIGSTFMAPAFIFMLYIDMLIIRGTGTGSELIQSSGADQAKFALAFAGQVVNFSVIYNFVLMIILLLAALTVASKVSSGAGEQGGKWAKSLIGGGAVAGIAGAGAIYRNSIGRAATNALKDKDLQARARLDGKVGAQARAQLEKYERLSKRTGDLRNSTVGKYMGAGLGMVGVSVGKGTTRTDYQRKEAVEKGEDEEIAKAKRLFPDNPVAQQKYLQERLGKNAGTGDAPGILKAGNKDKDLATRFGMNKELQTGYGEGRLKKVTDALDKEAQTKIDQDTLKKNIEDYTKLGEEMGSAAGEKMRKEITELFTKLGGKESLSTLNFPKDTPWKEEDTARMTAIAPLMNRQQVAAMAADPDKYGATLTNMTGTLMEHGTPDMQNYIIQQNKLGNPQLKIDTNAELQKKISAYPKGTVADLPQGDSPEAVAARAKYFADKEKHDAAIGSLIGAMSPKEVARLDNSLKSNEAVVRNYTNKHFDEIESYHKNIKMDADKPEQAQMFADIRNNASTKGTKATQKYMNESAKKENSAYYDESIKEKTKANIDDLKAKQKQALDKQTAAQSRAFQAKIMGDQAGEAAATAEAAAAEKEHNDLSSKVTKAENAQNKTSKDSSDDNDDDEGGA